VLHGTVTAAGTVLYIKHEGKPEHSSFLTFVFKRVFLKEGKRNRPFPMDYLHIFLIINGLTNLWKFDKPLMNLLTEDKKK